MDEIPKWFEGITLNYAENMLHPKVETLAIVSESSIFMIPDEYGQKFTLSHQKLYENVSKLAFAFKSYGIAANLPNDYRSVVAMLACSSLGATWTSIPPELQPIVSYYSCRE
ncbi:Acetoacetyl-CoA synthetase [Thelohanellus kitauei]|uniref:Acetoacetyl-CoA synthetase n=1 Tax=Thelohanellus kitauei TaxID=669202 RepID=A0A0C2JIX3_THEKT|nr:Acetoacetyl-CoA synthetase [Thelohanellus kitauei]